ncbi:MAG: outer membrane protein transport protein [Methylotenera sp.]
MKVKSNIKAVVAASLLGLASQAQAAGFALIEQSASGMGNAYAGAAATAEDASTIFFNPAGMTYIEGTQLVGALHLIKPNAEFNNNGSIKALFRPQGGEGGDAGDLAFVPNFYYKRDLTDTIKFGLGVNAPFGLKTEYDKDWIGRFQAIKSEVKSVNINPSIAFKVNDQLSLGAGISAMWFQAELTRAVNLGAAERSVKIKGDDWGFGVNLGAIYQATTDTRFGLAYRSKVRQDLEGKSTSNYAPLNTDVTAGISLPENVSFSAFSHVNDKWDVMGDVTWTHWSRFKELRIDFANALPDSVTAENWENTTRYSLGVNYHYSDTLKLRAGVAYDQEAIRDQYRTARIPGNDRKWLSLGANWKASPNSMFDIGYSHLFISDAKIDDNQTVPLVPPPGNGRLRGSYDGSVDILSLQYTHNF